MDPTTNQPPLKPMTGRNIRFMRRTDSFKPQVIYTYTDNGKPVVTTPPTQ